MSTTALVGLIWVCTGLGALWLGRLFEGMGVRKYARYHPGNDVERYRRRSTLQRRAFAGVAMFAGTAVLIYGLLVPNP